MKLRFEILIVYLTGIILRQYMREFGFVNGIIGWIIIMIFGIMALIIFSFIFKKATADNNRIKNIKTPWYSDIK